MKSHPVELAWAPRSTLLRARPRLVAAAALLGAIALAPAAAQAQELRFTDTRPGNVIATGNSLGLSKQTGANGPGTADSIGTFTTLDTSSFDLTPVNPGDTWFAGTTSTWQDNSSSAFLVLPSSEAQILYAELVWGGSWADSGSILTDLELNTPVTLSFGNDSMQVSPDGSTSVKVGDFCSGNTGALCRYYVRSADVTSFVAQHLGGEYSVSGVPATQHELTNNLNAAGWTLVIAYRYDGEPIRNMSIFVGGIFVNEDTTVDYEVDGFCAPPSTPIEGTIAIATLEGDSNRVGDQIAIGETIFDPTFVTLEGPNNPEDNFFCSQINGPDGLLDDTGTFGDRNHPLGSNADGARQGWDVAHTELTSSDGHLVPDQTSAVLRTQTLSDSYMPVLAGIAIDVNAPKFLYENSTTVVDPAPPETVTVGDSFTLTVRLLNEGSAPANNLLFTVDLPEGVALSSFTTNGATGDINGNTVTLGTVESGVDMGDLDSDEERIVEASFEITAEQSDDIDLRPIWYYDYQICINDAPTSEEFNAAVVSVDYEGVGGEGGGGQGGAGEGGTGIGGEGNTGNQGGSGDGGGTDGFTAVPEGGGLFRCSAIDGGSSRDLSPWALLTAAAAFGVARRRRRS
ncbi:MAG: hypothetical protein IPM79_17635 [Polyangiaceae bacterium]|jgi:uncharacterized repeat protein (TIGR01451 family)|nr:hypothetical protein [Polyangiaceae bacterium]MBK8939390.1 hypothetical protein [Polyangiaceae bacterium]